MVEPQFSDLSRDPYHNFFFYSWNYDIKKVINIKKSGRSEEAKWLLCFVCTPLCFLQLISCCLVATIINKNELKITQITE